MRSTPLQQRSSERIAHFLEVAAAIIAEVGYEALTMTAIAERADASIGALYRWFPDKAAIAQELRNRYGQELDELLVQFVLDAKSMPVTEFSDALIDRIVAFTRLRPAWLALRDAPIRLVRTPAVRQQHREEMAGVLRAYAPELPSDRALLSSKVAFGILKGLIGALGQASEEEWEGLTREFKAALSLYLRQALG